MLSEQAAILYGALLKARDNGGLTEEEYAQAYNALGQLDTSLVVK